MRKIWIALLVMARKNNSWQRNRSEEIYKLC